MCAGEQITLGGTATMVAQMKAPEWISPSLKDPPMKGEKPRSV
jgi:hypothetical protein